MKNLAMVMIMFMVISGCSAGAASVGCDNVKVLLQMTEEELNITEQELAKVKADLKKTLDLLVQATDALNESN